MAIKKYSKVKFTLRKELIIILSAIVVLMVATILLNLPNKDEKFVAKWSEAGSQIVEKQLYEETTFDDLNEVIAGDNVTFVFFATPSNPDSVAQFDSIMTKFAPSFDVEKVYIIDSEEYLGNRDEDADLDKKLTAIEEEFGVNLDSATNLWAFKGGQLLDSADNHKVSDVIDWNLALAQVFVLNK